MAANTGVKVRDINFKALLGKEAGHWVCHAQPHNSPGFSGLVFEVTTLGMQIWT